MKVTLASGESPVLPTRNGCAGSCEGWFELRDYDLASTLTSGQAFRWYQVGGAWEGPATLKSRATTMNPNSPLLTLRAPSPPLGERDGVKGRPGSWEGVIGQRWVQLESHERGVLARTVEPVIDWRWLSDYLQFDVDLGAVLATFPKDPALQRATAVCRGLRLLRQEPWECLASFVLSSTKQIVQIRQMTAQLSERYGEPVKVPAGHSPAFAFPTPKRLAACSESELRECRLGFRASYLRAVAEAVASGQLDLDQLGGGDIVSDRAELMALPGVGRKIADCVLLFAYGYPEAFPVDVWVLKALQQLYFLHRRVPPRQLRDFSETHFGPYAGYAQQYLFHYMRTVARPARAKPTPTQP